ncbi:MAG: P1 family peptidase [Thermoplasmata archaeon]
MRPRRVSILPFPGLRVGHARDPELDSGVTVLRFDRAAPVALVARGGASATYDTGSLGLDATFGRRWAIFFSGGSVYGLDAGRGVRTRLLEEGEGGHALGGAFPILPIAGAAIFDLPSRPGPIPDYLPLGYEATRSASSRPFPSGRIGAGAGATLGKYLGRRSASRGGLGALAVQEPFGRIGALAVVNAAGAVRDPETGRWLAGARDARGRIVPPAGQSHERHRMAGGHTTLAAIVTDLAFDRPALARIAEIATAGAARTVVPYATSVDGDLTFAASTERRALPRAAERPWALVDAVGTAAAALLVEAIGRAVRSSGPTGPPADGSTRRAAPG